MNFAIHWSNQIFGIFLAPSSSFVSTQALVKQCSDLFGCLCLCLCAASWYLVVTRIFGTVIRWQLSGKVWTSVWNGHPAFLPTVDFWVYLCFTDRLFFREVAYLIQKAVGKMSFLSHWVGYVLVPWRVALQRNLGILGHFNFLGAHFDQDSSIKHFSALNAERMKLIQSAMDGLGWIRNELI